MKTLRTSAFRISPVLCLLASVLWLSPFLASRASAQAQAWNLSQNPLLPAVAGTYSYEGYDSENDRYVYISLAGTGTYYYVSSLGVASVGSGNAYPSASAYRVVIAAGVAPNFQFYNAHAGLLSTVTTSTAFDPVTDAPIITTATTYDTRSGTYFARDMTLTLVTTDASAIWAVGYTGSGATAIAHPVTFIGTNVDAIVSSTLASSRQAVSARNGGDIYMFGGTIEKTVLPDATGTNFAADSSEAIYLVGNQEGHGSSSHFYGEDLTIIADGPNIGAITMGNGNNTVTLKRSTITVNNTRGNTSQAIYLNDAENLGGNHFYGENLLITNASGRAVALGVNGENSFTLVSSTLINNGIGAAIGLNATAASTGDRLTSSVLLEDTTILTTANYSPIFQQIGNRATLTVTDCTLTTTGVGSTGIRLVAQNDNYDSTRNTVTIKNSLLEAKNASAIDVNIDAANTTNYGQAGGGAKNIGTKVEDSYSIIIQSSTVMGSVAALRVASGGSGTSPFTNFTDVYIYNSTFSGGIQMAAGALTGFTCGASLTVTASNAIFDGGINITGSTPFRRSNQAIFWVYDSTWTGNIDLTNRGNLTLQFKDTPIEGALSASGSSQVQLRLTNSPITDGITTAGTAEVTGTILGEGVVKSITAHGGLIDLTLDNAPAEGIAADGTGRVALRIGGDVAFGNGLQLSGNGAIGITLRNTARLDSDITILDRATFSLATALKDDITLAGDITLGGIWQIPSKTMLAGNLALTGSLGTIAIASASPDILTLTHGLSGNGRIDIQAIDGITLGTDEFRVIHDPTGTFTSATSATFILSHPVDYGLAAYDLENRPDGAYLVGGLGAGTFGSGGAAVFNSQALAAEDWFASLAPVNRRLGQLRQSNVDLFTGASTAGSRAHGDSGALWLQSRIETTTVNRPGASLDFTSRTIGLTAGVEALWDLDDATFSTGAFADATRISRDFYGTADGRATGVGGGVYALYHNRKGLHIAAIARYDACENDLNTNNPNNAMSANYHTQAGGAALEAGWRFMREDGWWFEPAFQIAFASLPGVTYTTSSNRSGNIVRITVDDASATQQYFRFSLGRNLNQNWSFRGHAAAAYTSVTGGKFTATGIDNKADFTVSGLRVEASAGFARLMGRSGRLTIDATTTHAANYKRPYGISIGYAHLW